MSKGNGKPLKLSIANYHRVKALRYGGLKLESMNDVVGRALDSLEAEAPHAQGVKRTKATKRPSAEEAK